MLQLLTVCTGNICRSPLAAMLIASGTDGIDTADLAISSAGTHAVTGAEMSPRAQALARGYGVSAAAAERHRSRPVRTDDVEQASLILAMARDHRRFILEGHPAARRKTFTVREFARLADSIGAAELSAVIANESSAEAAFAAAVEQIASQRGRVSPPKDPADDDVIDPYRRSGRIYRRSGQQLTPAADRTVRLLVDCFAAFPRV